MNNVFLNYVDTPTPDECNKCGFLPICQGGCLSERIKNNNEPYCYINKVTVNRILNKIYEIWSLSNEKRNK